MKKNYSRITFVTAALGFLLLFAGACKKEKTHPLSFLVEDGRSGPPPTGLTKVQYLKLLATQTLKSAKSSVAFRKLIYTECYR